MLSILLVDEDASLRLLFSDALRAAGHQVETAPDEESAGASIDRQHFDLVITDALPLLRRTRRRATDTEVLLTTFRPGVPEAAFLLAEGAADYLIKPFDVDDAVARIERLFEDPEHRPEKTEVQKVLLVGGDARLWAELTQLVHTAFPHAELERGDRPLAEHDVMLVCADFDQVLELQSFAPAAPLVVIGKSADEALAIRAVQVGAQEYLPAEELDAHRLSRAIRCAIERKRAEQRLIHLAHHDPLTGLANAMLFRERLSHARARSRRDKRKLALMFLDLDRFHTINDAVGHELADTLLREVAKRLKRAVRDQDTVARLFGDAFALMVEDVADKREAELIAQRVLELVREPISIGGEKRVVTASIGLAVSPEVWDTAGDLVSSADAAMRLAKERGRDNYFTFGDDRPRSKAEHDLRLALERDELVLYYQPLWSIAGERIVGMEALLRWKRPGGTVVPPADFIPFLEETGLIVPVGAHVLDMACGEARCWKDAGKNGQRISVNLSAVQLERDDLPITVMQAVDRAGISPEALQLEITETVLMRDTARAQAALASLKNRGVRIAIDDFGTGYSSLAYIHRFPIDTVKIDRTFIRQIEQGKSGAAIVGAIIGLAHKLNMEVVAEGVETEAELAFLKREGCDLIQGFLSGRPDPTACFGPAHC